MKTRKSFLYQIRQQLNFMDLSIGDKRFYDINEQDYVLSTLDKLSREYKNLSALIQDFTFLEQQRYRILSEYPVSSESSTEQIGKAIHFCELSNEEKYKSRFQMNSNLQKYLISTQYYWGFQQEENQQEPFHYLCIPSFIPQVAPKEMDLSGFHSILLDIMNYDEVFSFSEFLSLVEDNMAFEGKDLKQFLVDFLTEQTLYYQTILLED